MAEGERVRLARFSHAEAPLILELLNDPAWLRFIGDRNVRSLEDARGYIDRILRSYAADGFGFYVVERKADAAALGLCGLVKRPTLPHADLGFAFLERFRGQGYALEASRATLGYARGTLGLARILAVATPDNERSAALLARLGFVREERIPWNGKEDDLVDLWASEPQIRA